ncbi:uncharacterized protein LOC131686905 [Topomyia yanbarensis]|uniref:uncharacterized protein LOC131686905 n=1 Tax=Topomyia yanbarensis TaxID=2498891 RepID=UPI00273BB36E|nr:uncharacterized protein LOC131686905 [Topomyia yanbarensis]
MPRNYKRKTCRRSWSKEQLNLAKDAVSEGVSIKCAAKSFGIPRITLLDHVRGKVTKSKLGPKETVFTADQENELIHHMHDLESRFYGITKDDIRQLAFELAERNGIQHPLNKQKRRAGRDWLYRFMKRNPKLTFRKAEATSAARAGAFNKVSVDSFFDMR